MLNSMFVEDVNMWGGLTSVQVPRGRNRASVAIVGRSSCRVRPGALTRGGGTAS